MNENGHDRWSEDVAAYVLGALEPERAAELERHAEGCERCREEMRWLRAGGGGDRRSGAAARAAAGAARAAAGGGRGRRPRRGGRGRAGADGGLGAAWRRLGEWLRGAGPGARWRPLAAGLAVVVLLAAGVAGYEVGSGGGGSAAPPTPASSAGITAEVVRRAAAPSSASPTSASCRPTGCSRPGCSAKATVEPVKALFVPDRDGNASTMIADMSGVEIVMVTREPAGGTTAPTGEPLVEVPISRLTRPAAAALTGRSGRS